MSVTEMSITNPKKQLEFYKQLSEQLQQENQQLKETNDKLYQQLDLYKNVIEEVREKLKLERKIALSLNQPYTVSIVDSTLNILDKVKEEQ